MKIFAHFSPKLLSVSFLITLVSVTYRTTIGFQPSYDVSATKLQQPLKPELYDLLIKKNIMNALLTAAKFCSHVKNVVPLWSNVQYSNRPAGCTSSTH